MSTLSVAMATYQGARFLPEQLESLAGQSRLPDELVGMTPHRKGELLRELACGRYHRYSLGFESAGFDLLFRGRERG